MALLAASFNLLFGYTGLLSFGQAAYFGIGAYVCGLILMNVSSSIWLGILGGIVLSTFSAAAIGFFCVRLTGIYFSMLTLAFGQMVYAIAFKWYDVTGGDNGLVGVPKPMASFLGLISFDLSSPLHYYYFVLAFFLTSIFLLWKIIRSPLGYVLMGIRENLERVGFSGLEVKNFQLIAFSIAGFFAGLAGTLYAPFASTVSPEIVGWTKSAEPVLMTLLGGNEVFLGPILGSWLFLLLKDYIISHTEFWEIYFGVALVFLVIFLPGGVMGFVGNVMKYWGSDKF
jgi:branched-chain amino acid transport system permease protein